jgi:hypothetical protein
MVIDMRRTLLILVTLLAHSTPPSRPPGRRPVPLGAPAATVPLTGPCPYRNCHGEGGWQKEFLYVCDTCDKPFYYCTGCKSFYPRGKEGEHKHSHPVT